MEFISKEEFLKQPKEVQNIFIEWYKPSIGDLACIDTGKFTDIDIYNGLPYRKNLILKCLENEKDIELMEYDFPLLTEGQIRKFIEDKTNCKLNIGNISKIIDIYKKELDILYKTDLLQAYFKVAIQIAQEETNK